MTDEERADFLRRELVVGNEAARQALENMRLRAALLLVRGIIVEGAAVGFNPLDGNWADRLYASQADTFEALYGRRSLREPAATDIHNCGGTDG